MARRIARVLRPEGLALLLALALLPGSAAAQQALPEPAPPGTGAARIQAVLAEARAKFEGLAEGRKFDSIPALAKVPSELFGIALVTTGGETYSVGDAEARFTIQSISKVFVMALVMQERGAEVFLEGVGVDATGQAFDSVVAIEQNRGHEMNPLVNPGAIATSGLVAGSGGDEKWRRIRETLSAFAGRELELNEAVYGSEAASGRRNQAIAALMHAHGLIEDDPKRVTELYVRQCSLDVSAKDLAVMAATLANGGRNPVTGRQVLDPEHVPKVLAVMATAGLYEDSGIWLYKVGLPAKSGVGGGLLAVAPGAFGIAAFSPPLDRAGNSVRAQRAIAYAAEELGANPYASRPR